MNINFKSVPRQPKGLLAQVLTVIVGTVSIAVAVMFSMVFLAVVAIAGLVIWLYFWWKTRAVRAQLRQQMEAQSRARGPEDSDERSASSTAGDIIEGEAVRVVDEKDRLR